MMGVIAFILVLGALPSSWYSVHCVGPDFRTVGPDGPEPDDERRQLDGSWSITTFRLYNETWEGQDTNPSGKWNATPIQGEGGAGVAVNGHSAEVYRESIIALGAGIGALCLAAFGMWNIAHHDRYRWFTAASMFLAAVLFLGGCYNYAMSLPEAMMSDASLSSGDSFGALFEPYIDPEGGEPGFYFEFEGGYPSDEPTLGEQLQYGPGSGWWLAGAAGVFALVASAILVAAPSVEEERAERGEVREVVRYVPIPTVGDVKRRRRYPKRMPAVSRNSPSYRRGRKGEGR
jgi:hypothetical protein